MRKVFAAAGLYFGLAIAAHAATINYQFTAGQFLDAIRTNTYDGFGEECGSSADTGCAFYAVVLNGASAPANSTAATAVSDSRWMASDVVWMQDPAGYAVSFLTRADSLAGQFVLSVGPYGWDPRMLDGTGKLSESTILTARIDSNDLLAATPVTFNFTAFGVTLGGPSQYGEKNVQGAFSITQTGIPEPTPLLLIGVGLAMLTLRRRRVTAGY